MKYLRLLLIASLMTTSMVYGCSPETRYRTLSFFFDGVPNPDAAGTAASGNGARRGGLRGKTDIKPSNHGPYAARLCTACHQPGGGNKLILPVEELCLNCHNLNIRKKHTHGPVASGGCRVCHEPHGSGRPFLLADEAKKFCFYCHEEADVRSREAHMAAADMQCTDCHDPHASDSDFLLK